MAVQRISWMVVVDPNSTDSARLQVACKPMGSYSLRVSRYAAPSPGQLLQGQRERAARVRQVPEREQQGAEIAGQVPGLSSM